MGSYKVDDREAASLYRSGFSTRQVGHRLSVSVETVRAALRRQDISICDGRKVPVDDDRVATIYRAGATLGDIAAQLHVSQFVVRESLNRSQVKRRTSADYRRRHADPGEVIRLYLGTKSSKKVARVMCVPESTVLRILHEHQVRTRKRAYVLSDNEAQRAVELYREGATVREICKALGVPERSLRSTFKRLAIGRADRGSINGPRKWVTGKGGAYLAVRIPDDDPFACMRQAGGYVLEHRLAMARHLGRPLLPGESVHHINNDGHDNRLENLQLRIGKHGRGYVLQCIDCGSHRLAPAPLA